MKKLIVFLLAAIVAFPIYAQEEASETAKKEKRKAYVRAADFNHWSIAIGGGANFMYGEGARSYINGSTASERINGAFDYIKNSANWAVKAELEYMMNPIWGINLQYMYDPQNKNNLNRIGYTTDRDLAMHEALFQFLFNPLNVARRCRTYSEWNMYFGLGLGATYFQRGAVSNYEYRPMLSVPASIAVEYSPISALGIFLDVQYRWYLWDGVNGVCAGPQNDMAFYAGLGLRYHIVSKNHKGHVRVIDMNTYEPLTVSDNNRDVAALETKVNQLSAQIARLNMTPAPTNAHEVVAPTISDDEINQKVNAAVQSATAGVNSQIQSLDHRVSNLENDDAKDSVSVYFDYNSAKVKSEYQLLIAKVAKRLLTNGKEKVVILGYCDAKGGVAYNKELAQKRVDAIVTILVNRYNIDKARISTQCVGRVEGSTAIDIIDRRCDIKFE